MTFNNSHVHCDACGKAFDRAQPFDGSVPVWGSYFTLSGGYAEFWDDLELPNFQLKICHDCTLPLFRMIMGSEKYAHLKMDFFGRSHANENPPYEHECCEYSYDGVE